MFKVKEIQRYIELAQIKLDKIGNREGKTIWKVIGTYKTLSTKSGFIQYYIFDMLTKSDRNFSGVLYEIDRDENWEYFITPTNILADVTGAGTIEEFATMTTNEGNVEYFKNEAKKVDGDRIGLELLETVSEEIVAGDIVEVTATNTRKGDKAKVIAVQYEEVYGGDIVRIEYLEKKITDGNYAIFKISEVKKVAPEELKTNKELLE